MLRAVLIQDLAITRGERRLFSGLDLALRPGEAVVLTGRNGAGKTSLLRAVAGLLRPEAGQITFEDLDAETARAEHLHMVGHHDGLKSSRSAWEELRFQTLWTGGGEAGARAAIDRFDLHRLLELEVRRLSAGQRRRLALARLVASPRALWLLDEPANGLDASAVAMLEAAIIVHRARGGIALVATHTPIAIHAAQHIDLGASSSWG